MLFTYETTVNKHTVYLYVTEDGEVGLKINGRYDRRGVCPRAGAVIIRRCRKALLDWFEASDESELWCTPYAGDGNLDLREKVFHWVGFRDDGWAWKLRKPKRVKGMIFQGPDGPFCVLP